MRNSSSSYGVAWGRPLSRDPWANNMQPVHNSFPAVDYPGGFSGLGSLGAGDAADSNAATPLGELQPVGWLLTGAGIGWASAAYSTGEIGSNETILSAWGGASAAVALLGLRRIINGDTGGLGAMLLGIGMGVSGYYFGATKRGASKPSRRSRGALYPMMADPDEI